jgi:nitroimidazol reductase NimA-like FMN-containing flavoprotein (pyridoxamine 5'-phosphate oxidase superfamily)
MKIDELTRQASLDFLAGSRFGRLACARLSQPYITPFNFAYHDHCIYSFSTVGQKIEWLRANPLACVEVDDIASPQQWTSVIVFGRYEELSATGDGQAACELACKLLQQRPVWWEPGFARTTLHGTPRPLEPVYYRLSVEEISGHRATPG